MSSYAVYTALVAVLFRMAACSIPVYYLGEEFQASSSVEVYYSYSDITGPYKVIGKLTHSTSSNRPERIKEAMIERAKAAGADAIVFTDMDMMRTGESDEGPSVKAELIRYE